MPNRIIKESICTSDSVDALTWFEEVLFYRLIVNCDDYGRFDGRPSIIKNRLFPLKENLTVKAVSAAINKLASVGLVILYEFEGKPYLYLPTWNCHQNVRAKRSKYPAPNDGQKLDAISMNASASKCEHVYADVPVIQSNPNPNPNPNARARRADQQDEIFADFPGELGKAVADWLAYKTEKRQGYKPTGLQSLLTQIRNAAKEHGDAAVVKVIRDSMAANYQGIVFDRLSRNEKPGKKTSAPESKFDAQPSKAEQERLKQLLEGMGG